jgi:hypothetical protein
MNQSTFDTFVRSTATLLYRRALFGGASATLLTIAGLPPAAEAKTKGKGKRGKADACCRESEFCPGAASLTGIG